MSDLSSWIVNMLHRRDAGISVPAMDGVLKPNSRLEDATCILNMPGIDDVVAAGSKLVVSAGSSLLAFPLPFGGGDPETISTFEGAISFLAVLDDGRYAVGVTGKGVYLGVPGSFTLIELAPELSACMMDATQVADGRLAICIGSLRNPANEWKRDLMEKGRSGCLCLLDLDTGSSDIVAEDLAFPYGVAARAEGSVAVAESWRHRIVAINPASKKRTVLLEDLPAYLSRISPALNGGYWLTFLAPRRQLFEFVLREDGFRKEMLETVDSEEWVGPSLSASTRYDHPLQQGAVRQMGILKPWAPSSSYGLVVRCDENMRPVESLHSRADGALHGITGICETDDGVFAVSRGAGKLVRFTGDSAGSAASEVQS
ncbi:strictosidine synthase [Hoeflea sp. CAU 1731]